MRQCITIPILDDSISEDPERFIVNLTISDPDITSTIPSTDVFIIDEDRVSVGIEMETYSTSENFSSVEVCVVVVTGVLNREITVSLSTSPSTAEGTYLVDLGHYEKECELESRY